VCLLRGRLEIRARFSRLSTFVHRTYVGDIIRSSGVGIIENTTCHFLIWLPPPLLCMQLSAIRYT
jgi:hypothetical protein